LAQGQAQSSSHFVSIILPTRNGAGDLAQLLPVLHAQHTSNTQIELIVLDSCSTDETLTLAQAHAATIVRVSPNAFHHANTRNLGVQHARGDVLLFLTQDVLPVGHDWLNHALQTLTQYPKMVALSFDETPRYDADLYAHVRWQHHRDFLGVKKGIDYILLLPPSARNQYIWLRRNSHLSNVACLVRKSVFDRYQFRADFAEDIDLGVRLIKDGHALGFIGRRHVIHSHNRPAQYHLKRAYVDTLAMRKLFADFPLVPIDPNTAQYTITHTQSMIEAQLAWAVHHAPLSAFTAPAPSQLLGHFDQVLQPLNADSTLFKPLVRYIHSQLKTLQGYLKNTPHPTQAYEPNAIADYLSKSAAAFAGISLAAAYLQLSPTERDVWQEFDAEMRKDI
jgi:GT2 family glycosyltransferase